MFSNRTNWNLAPNRLSEALSQRRSRLQPIFDLTASNPTECGFQYDTEAILRALQNPEVISYQPDPKGFASARSAVAEYYRNRGVEIPPGDIILTTSTSEAYSFVFRTLCNPREELLVPSPSYPLFEYLADIQDIALSPYPLVYDHGWQLDFHALQKSITERTRGIIVVNPNNPTGSYIKRAELEILNAICMERGIAIIADEVFWDFALDASPTWSFAGNNNSLTFTLSGLSKISGLPQMKAAWLAASGPERIKSQAIGRLEIIADTFLSLNTPVQLALPVLLDQSSFFHKQAMARVQNNLAVLDRQLALKKSASRLRVEGGWYAVLRVPVTQSDEDLSVTLLEEKGVYVHPGHFYNFPSEGYIVLSLIVAEGEFAEGVTRLLPFL